MSVLTGIFGIDRLQLAEDVVQEALVRALQTWPYYGIPKNPAAWITQTAKNLALDLIRREKLFRDKQSEISASFEQWSTDSVAGDSPLFDTEIKDGRLRLMFACCHPLIPQESQTALALKTLCGFGAARNREGISDDRSSDCQEADARPAKNPGAEHSLRDPVRRGVVEPSGWRVANSLLAFQRRLQGVQR